ncbi:uncharacterized protein LOC124449260 [Xenia sp. Carnegie-2017]|uniref:uncharacterized protein LOC124449260 n=1 Tax=Xenia sp. Carnegie-2017 TaxID=2897299 RepID=UPI001F047BE7|nr:uncharacterized protein LOC124449260 [Xenia sp. Carnegie-2017]
MKFYIALLLCGFSAALKKENEKMQLVAEFNGRKIRGSILFTQEDMENVTISFKDLTISPGSKIAIHKFPMKYVGLPNESCSTNNIGDIFYPENCPENISRCYFDDLSKNPKVMVSGKNSIFGRSIAIHDKNDNILACSTIKSKKSHSLFLVGVFQSTLNGIAGTIVLGQPASNPAADTMVDINLQLVDPRSEPLTGLSFGVYVSTTSSTVEGSCKGLKNMFNPFGKTSCDQRRHSTCAIGDLSGKLGYLDVPLPGGKNQYQFFIDSNLPLSGENSVMGNSLVIMQNGQLLICAKLQQFQEMITEVTLGEAGIVRFNQGSFYSPPTVNVSLGNEYDDDLFMNLHLLLLHVTKVNWEIRSYLF